MEVSSTPVDGVIQFLSGIFTFAYIINCILGFKLQGMISKDATGKLLWGLSIVIFILYPFALHRTMKTTKSIFQKKKIDPILDFGGCHLALWVVALAIASTVVIRFANLDFYSENEFNVLIYGLTASAGLFTIGTLLGSMVLFSSRKKIQNYIASRKKAKASKM
ncbi:hypothetical protein RYA05_06305 [Pseudomonas syringae pv. actinidiae]|nr:hypothetical protein [Pseudomonas syringae pv. actinidiae]